MKADREYILYLEDMIVSIDRILDYTKSYNYYSFINDQKTIDAVTMNFANIGEATKNIPTEIKDKYNSIPWKQMYGLRNYVSHEYFGVSLETIWQIIENDLKENKKDIEAILIDLKK